MDFALQYVYDYITKLCRQQAKVIQNHENANVPNIGQGEHRHRKYKRLKRGGGQAYDRSVQKLLSSRLLFKHIKIRIYKTMILPVVLYGCET
jgi:hypothetical protein